MSKVYEWKETDGGWDAFDGPLAVARVYKDRHTDLGDIYIAYAYSNPDEKSRRLTLEQAKIAAINLHEYPAEVEAETPSPGTINRLDPAWAMFAAAVIPIYAQVQMACPYTICADFADAMIRERDRRDREERP